MGIMKEKAKKMKETKNCSKVKIKNSKERGITLIALIVTIIVLLILAGITIATLTGENGIITRAREAGEQTEIGREKEEIALAWNGAVIDKLGGTDITAGELNEQFEKNNTNATASGSINVEFTDSHRWYKIDSDGNITGPFTDISETETKLIDLYHKAQEDGCEGGESCTNPEEHLHIGDYVHFENPTSGSYTAYANKTGMEDVDIDMDIGITDQTYEITSSKNQLNWRVLGEEDGKVKLIAGSPLKSDNQIDGQDSPYLYMYGARAYTDGYKELDNICNKLYGSISIVDGARSVNQKDIDEAVGVTEETIAVVNLDPIWGSGLQYGEEYNFPTGHYTPESWLDGEQSVPVSGTVDGYYYAIISEEEESPVPVTVDNERIFNMLFNNVEGQTGASYWLASRGVYADDSNYARFGLNMVNEIEGVTNAGTSGMFYSDGREGGGRAAVRPVVVLKSEVSTDEVYKIDDQTEEIWNIELPLTE